MMAALTMRDIAAALQTEYRGPELAVTGVTTDSRQVRAGDLYVALRGERFDGNDFVADVAAKGAAAAVLSRPVSTALPHLTATDTRAALGLIARINRRRFSGPVIGVTGSAGKTTCKEMLAAILAQCGPVLATQGNLNNEIGVPLTLLRLAPEHRYAVIEMGAARAGDIAYLCRFAEPDVGLVTSALPAHLEGFGSVATVAATKGELFEGVRAQGTAVVNNDDVYAELWKRQADGRNVLTFGLSGGAVVTARNIVHHSGGTRFELLAPAGSVAVELQLLGLHNVRNALGAAAAAFAVGAPLTAVGSGLASVRPVAGRLQPRLGVAGNTVIDDSYNANPGAVQAAIDVLAQFAGPHFLILGNMAELGPTAETLHREVARYAKACGIEQLWCVGPWAVAMAADFGPAARAFADNAALIAALPSATPAAAVLVKGSRSAGMEVVVAALCGSSTVGEGH
jgi:UDP-N-acetylmuramoyl-tripeptide--D-alanyl-D-alanine ligase